MNSNNRRIDRSRAETAGISAYGISAYVGRIERTPAFTKRFPILRTKQASKTSRNVTIQRNNSSYSEIREVLGFILRCIRGWIVLNERKLIEKSRLSL